MGEEPQATGDKPEPKQTKPFQLVVPRWTVYTAGCVVLVLISLPVIIYVWRALTLRNLAHRMETQQAEMVGARREALKVQARDMLRLAARPLGWAVRAEMLRSNLSQVDDYIRQFVREPGVRSLILVGKDGLILLASDRKLETQNAAPLVSRTIREAADVVVEESGDSIRIGVPIMGFDDRMGVLVVDYAPPTQQDLQAGAKAP